MSYIKTPLLREPVCVPGSLISYNFYIDKIILCIGKVKLESRPYNKYSEIISSGRLSTPIYHNQIGFKEVWSP